MNYYVKKGCRENFADTPKGYSAWLKTTLKTHTRNKNEKQIEIVKSLILENEKLLAAINKKPLIMFF